MRDESIAANRTKLKDALEDPFRFGALQFGQKSVVKHGGKLSGEFSESISLIEAAIYSK
jgi:carbon monoxide dehydrogenase subunit G